MINPKLESAIQKSQLWNLKSGKNQKSECNKIATNIVLLNVCNKRQVT